jgi:hypothetical protein
VVALTPVGMPGGIENEDAIKTKFEALVTAKLQEGNFRVIRSEEYGTIWKEMTEKLGGFFDPLTGKRDEQKYKTVREHTLRELATKTGADAVMGIAVSVVRVNFGANVASWHGTRQDLVPGGAFTAYLIGGSSGTVPALSLFVALSDIHGTDMYSNAGGLHVLSKISAGRFVEVPQAELFADEDRNRKAADIALNPLIGKSQEPQSTSNSSSFK